MQGAEGSEPPRPHVVVTVARSGGFAGITRTWTADSAQLPQPDGDRLVELAVAARQALLEEGTDAPPAGEAAPGLPDAFTYDVDLRVGRQHRTARLRRPTDQPELAALVEHVRSTGNS